MATTRVFIPCPGCRQHKPLRFLALREDGSFDVGSNWFMEQRLHAYGGRANITVSRDDLPVGMALGLRDMLRARLEQVEAELRAAGIEG